MILLKVIPLLTCVRGLHPPKYIKNFTAEYKTKVVLELLESEDTISQLSKKYEITPKTIQNWKKQ